MPDWLVEKGIGEQRFVRIAGDEIVEARVLLDGTVPAGTRLTGRLKSVRPQTIVEADGQDYLLPKGAPGSAEGAGLVIEVTREAIPGAEPWKRPLAKIVQQSAAEPSTEEAVELPFPAPTDRLAEAGWWDLVEEARSGVVRFEGGELRMSPTPAMTLIDIDGYLSPPELALAGATAAARAVVRHNIGGSIGIDFPTISGKPERQAIAAAIDAALAQPFERTAVNGFGFLQIVRPRRHASSLELAQDRAAFEARALLRRAAFEQAGAKCLVASSSVVAALEAAPAWLAALSAQVGGSVTLRTDPKLPIHGGYAQTL